MGFSTVVVVVFVVVFVEAADIVVFIVLGTDFANTNAIC
jgi:hypothetical protein